MITKYAFSIGLVVRRGERTFEFERRLSDNTVVFIDQLDKSPHRWPLSQVYRDIEKGKLQVVQGDSNRAPSSGEGLPLIFDIDSIPERYRQRVHIAYDYIRTLRRMGLSRGMRRKIESAIGKIANQRQEAVPFKATTLMRLWREYETNDNSVQAMVDGRLFREQPRRKPWAEHIIQDSLKKIYCTKKRRPLVEVVDDVNERLRAKALSLGQDPDAYKVSESTIRRYKGEIDPYTLDEARFGREYANNRWRYSLGGVGCTRAYARFEIDHTLLDIVVVCDRTGLPLGRPTITVVIDAYSGYITGFFVSFWGAGLSTTLSALKVAFGPKHDISTDALHLENQWLGMGICELLVMDNGLEFHSPQLRSVAMHLDMDLLYCKVRQPWLKPVVERSMGAAVRCLPASGRVYKPVDNCLPLDPKKTASITFSALCQGLMKAFVDEHASTPNFRKLARPIDLFQESIESLPPPSLPGPMNHLDIIVGGSKVVSIGDQGVRLDYLRFNSPDLQSLRRSVGHSFKTEIRFDPGNLAQLHVRKPDSPHWLAVPCCFAEYSNGLSLVQHKAIRQLGKNDLNLRNAEEILTKMKRELRDFWSSQVRAGKKVKANHLKAMGGLTSAHSLSSTSPSDLWLPPAQPQPAIKNIVCETDMAPAPLEIPVFDTVELH